MGWIRHFFLAKLTTRRWRRCSKTSHSSSIPEAQATPIHVFLLRFYQASCPYGDRIAASRQSKSSLMLSYSSWTWRNWTWRLLFAGSLVDKQCRFWVVYVNRCKYRRWHKRCNFVHKPWLSSSTLIWRYSRPFYGDIVVLDMCCYKI